MQYSTNQIKMAHHPLLPSASILLVLLFLSPPSTSSDVPVLDTDGNALEAGSQYYVLTSGRGAAGRGGLTAAPHLNNDNMCPYYVAQHRWWTEQGRPVTFHPANPSQKNITEGTFLNIAFSIIPICRSLGVWQLDSDGNNFFITTNGVIGGDPESADTFPNWFKLEQAFGPGSYKIVYCFLKPAPASGLSGRENCQQLDATLPGPPNSGLSFLSLVPIENTLPFFGFTFKKVTATATY